jgi:hypothetical protein
MAWYDSLIGGTTGGLLSAIGSAAAQQKAISDIEKAGQQDFSTVFGQDYIPPAGGLIGQAQRATEFKPFTVTTPTGTGAIGSSGGLTLGLSPEQTAMQQQLGGFTTSAFDVLGTPEAREAEQSAVIGMLTQDPSQRAARESDIFGRLTAAQRPEQERARLELEQRLANQGRLGVQTAMYGGTPEQLALQKAIQEQQANTAISAMEQARAEQALQSQQTLQGLGETRARLGLLGDLGLQSLGASYLPQQQLLAALQPSLEASRIGSALQSTGAGLTAQLGETGLEAQLGYSALANALRQQQFQGLFDLLKGEQTSQSQTNIAANPQSALLQAILKGTQDSNNPFNFGIN